jgi:hypothetical protein
MTSSPAASSKAPRPPRRKLERSGTQGQFSIIGNSPPEDRTAGLRRLGDLTFNLVRDDTRAVIDGGLTIIADNDHDSTAIWW